jgi:transcriptional regulator with XRE-family HTH domain
MNKFGKRILLVRHAFGLTQDDLARIAGSVKENVCRWEKGAFKPSDDAKRSLIRSLNLSIDWLIKGSDFPLLRNKITVLTPQLKYFDEGLPFVSESIDKAQSVEVLHKPHKDGDACFILLFHIGEEASAVFFYPPLGCEKAFSEFLAKHKKINLLDDVDFPDKIEEEKIKTSFEDILNLFNRILSKKAKHKEYFFVELYNVKKENLIDFIYAKAETFWEKLQKHDKLIYDKLMPEKLSVYQRQHKYFKSIVKKLIEGSDFTNKEKSIINEFTNADILEPYDRDWLEAFFVKGIKGKGKEYEKFDPFSGAYREIVGLIMEEGRKQLGQKLRIDKEKDELFWI